MKKIGIIGGIGPASTVEYYKSIIDGYRQMVGDDSFPSLFISSVNMTEMLDYVANNKREKLVNFLLSEISKLKAVGADYIAIASNTPHMVADELIEKSALPIISIVEETCMYAKNSGLKKVLLTGTLFTMKNNFYKTAFEKYGIECIAPNDEEKNVIHNIIFPDLENGIIHEKDQQKFKEICNKNIAEKNIDSIALACTELPLLVNQSDFAVSVIDTMAVHVKSILKKMMEK